MQYGLWLFLIVIMFVMNIGWYRRFGIEKGSKIRITELVLFRFCSKDGSVSSSQVIKIKSSTPFRRRWKSPPILNNKVLSKYLFRIGLIFTMSCLLPPWMDPTLTICWIGERSYAATWSEPVRGRDTGHGQPGGQQELWMEIILFTPTVLKRGEQFSAEKVFFVYCHYFLSNASTVLHL